MTSALPARAVYTALLGGYEELIEQPIAHESSIPFICLTDDPDVRSDTWEIQLIEPRLPMDLIRSARVLKVRGHANLQPYQETLWIDNSVRLKVAPESLMTEWLDDADIALPRHSYRRQVISEFDIVAREGLDDPSRVYEQLMHYSALRPEVLEEHPYWTAIIARRWTPGVTEAMSLWLDHVLRYSRRDQLSVTYALIATGLDPHVLDVDNFESDWHEWPVEATRKLELRGGQYQHAMRPPSLEIGRLRNDLVELSEQTEHAIRIREAQIEQLTSKLDLIKRNPARALYLAARNRLRSRR